MTDPFRPIKNPSRVPISLQVTGDPIGTAGVFSGPGVQFVTNVVQEPLDVSIKFNRSNNAFEVQTDGVYENPDTKDRFQFRKGHVVPENVAKTFKRVGPWPGEPDEEAAEAAATTRSGPTPLNNTPPAPETK